MKVAGFVAEFNPFHEGHKYLIDYIKKDANYDLIIVAMSPNFVMRGEPAIFDKFSRTEVALDNGINLVLEIPTIYAIEAADIYAKYAVEILVKAGVTDLYFGSESNDLDVLECVASLMNQDKYKSLLKRHLDEGDSFNISSKKAIIEIDNNLESIMSSPNDLLGIEYIKTINKNSYKINKHVVKRVSTGYYSELNENTNIQSASAIRHDLISGQNKYKFSYNISNLQKHVKEDYFDLIKYRILSSSLAELKETLFISDGFENRLKSIKNVLSYKELVDKLISKRDRETKVNRVLFALLLGLKKTDVKDSIEYLRVLGFDTDGRSYLKTMKDNVTPFITEIKKELNEDIYKEITYTKIYSLPYSDSEVYLKEYGPIIK